MRMTTTGSEGLPEKEASAELQVRRWETPEQYLKRTGESRSIEMNVLVKQFFYGLIISGKKSIHFARIMLSGRGV